MPVPSTLRRLLHVRNLEEEQCRLALESSFSELRQLEEALQRVELRGRVGRALWEGRTQGGVADRQAGRVEAQAAKDAAESLGRRMIALREQADRLRQAYLDKRVERRQADTLIEETTAAEAIGTKRREQQALDDAHRARLYRELRQSRGEEVETCPPPASSRQDKKNL